MPRGRSVVMNAGRFEPLSSSRWVHLLVLAVPFLVVIVGWHGLHEPFLAFQGGDEPIHFGIVRVVLDQWPRPLLSGYGAWSGPTVYWLLAGLAYPFGGSIEAVRLVVALFSWGACAIAYVLFRDRLHARPLDALALALLLAVSPFFFGQSFLVLTDNPTWFFVVLALERALAYRGAARADADRGVRRLPGARDHDAPDLGLAAPPRPARGPERVPVAPSQGGRHRPARARRHPSDRAAAVLGRAASSGPRERWGRGHAARGRVSGPQSAADPGRRGVLRRAAPAGRGAR